MNITAYFFYNSGWVLFIRDGDLVITVKCFTTVDGCWLFLIVNWSSLFVCFLQLWMGVVCFWLSDVQLGDLHL